jgi:hypothetical protein
MRKKIVTALAAGALGLSGLAATGTALAATGDTSTSTTASTSALDRIKTALAGLVTDKTLTQTQADKVATTLAASDIGRGGPGGHGGRGGHGGHGGGGMRSLATAATTLGMSEADLRTALDTGKTLAAIAKEKNVSVDTLVAALVKDAQTRLAQEVTDGRLTQARADEITKDLKARITEKVYTTRPARPAGPGNGTSDQAPQTAPSTPSTPSTSATPSN